MTARWIVTLPDGTRHVVRTPEAAVLLVRRGGVVVPFRSLTRPPSDLKENTQ